MRNKYLLAILSLLLFACGGPPKPSAGLADENLAALEQTVDLESPDVETDDALRFERSILSLGEVRLGTTRHVSLRAINTSKQPLVLMEVTTACGCTKVEWQKKPIPPHDSAELRIHSPQNRRAHSSRRSPYATVLPNIPYRSLSKESSYRNPQNMRSKNDEKPLIIRNKMLI